MAGANLVLKIKADTSDLIAEVQRGERTAASAAASMAQAYKKAGMDMSSAMKQAWADINGALEKTKSTKIDWGDTFEPLEENARDTRTVVRNVMDDIQGYATNAVSGIRSVASRAQSTLSGIGKVGSTALKGITAVSGVLSAAWGIAGAATVKYNANIEQLTTSFEVMTGSAEEAASIVERLKTMGAETPFETLDLAETTQLLMNYGITADEAISRMSMLGDIAQGSAEKMQRIATAYGQMSSAGKVQLEDIRQMIESGYNPLQEIAESTGESMASLYERISKGTLAVEEITASMERSTSEGGKYFESMAKQAETLSGRLSTLKDEAQSFLGNLFSGATDSLRDDVLPMATDIIDALNTGFESGGIDGLMNAFNRELPKLLTWGVNAAKNVMSGVYKQLPGLVKSLFSALPSLISSSTELIPELVTSLMGVASEVVENLIAQLPELVPMILNGIKNIGASIITGAVDIVRGIGDGIGTALKEIGLLEWSADEIVENAFANVDREHVEDIEILIEPDVEVEEPDVELTNLYTEIEEALTDGLADTPEIVDSLKQKVTDYYNTQIENVNAWREEALAGLDSTLPTEEYDAEVAEINAKADALVAGFEQASDATITWIETNAGRSTAAVEANVGDLRTIYQEAVTLTGEIDQMTGQARSAMDRYRQLVASGSTQDENVIATAYVTTAQEYKKAVDEANALYEEALQEAAETLSDDEYERVEKQLMAERDAALAEALASFKANMQELIQGAAESLAPEQLELLDPYLVTETLSSNLDGLNSALLSLANSGELDLSNAEAVRQAIVDRVGEDLGLTNEDWETLASAMGENVDPAALKQAIMENLVLLMQGSATTGLSMDGAQLLGALGIFSSFDQGTLNEIAEALAPSIQRAIEKGTLEGIEGVDLTDSQTLLSILLGTFGEESDVTIGVEPEVEVEDPEVTNPEGAREEIETATESALGGSDGEPVTVEQDVTAEAHVTTDVNTEEESGIEQAVQEQIQQTVGVDVTADVSLNVSVSDSNATEVGVSAGQEIGNGIVTGLSGKSAAVTVAASAVAGSATTGIRGAYQQYYSAGQYLGTGLANGIASKRSAVMAQARSIANAAAAAIRSALQISSPSKVTTQLGEYTGEGFEIGLTDSLTRAVESARRIAGTLNLTPRMDFPDVTGALTGAVGSIYESESGRSINLYINGKQMATTTAGDNRWAQANRARRIALGVGRKL